MPEHEVTEALIERLRDPSRNNRALLALLAYGQDAAAALAKVLLSSKPSTLSEPRLLAVEGLSILKGPDALNALIAAASQRLAEISDPVVRLAEEAVASRAASALAEFPEPSAREALIELLKGKRLIGVAEAFEKLRDPRAIPHLVSWLEDDFVAEPAARAIRAYGRTALPALFDSLSQQHSQRGSETRLSQRRRARILEILAELAPQEQIHPIANLLKDPVEAVRLNAVRAVLAHGNRAQQQRAFEVGIPLLDSLDRGVRADCEEILTSHFNAGAHLIENAIRERTLAGEPKSQRFPRETTLATLRRIHHMGSKSTEVPR